MECAARAVIREGRYVDLTDASIRLNGAESSPQAVERTLKSVNPVLDLEKDLALGRYFYAREVIAGEGTLTVRGTATIPRAGSEPRKTEP